MITEQNKVKRMQKAKILLKRFTKRTLQKVVYSDEKILIVEEAHNPQNMRIWGKKVCSFTSKKTFIQKIQKPGSVMVWAGICATGKTPLHFVRPQAKINAEYYQEHILKNCLLPWSEKHFKKQHWTFQQDSAPAHKGKSTIMFCKNHFPDLISPDEWPFSSPDLNPLDYSVWSYLESKVSATPHSSIKGLKLALIKAWNQLSVNQLRDMVENFPIWLGKLIKANGDVFEK
jgi:hypothetical protein